jgi:hypothetical protein
VQSPGAKGITDPAYEPKLKAYVEGVVGAFANDDRILGWDIWNEPDNGNESSYPVKGPKSKAELVAALLPKAFEWARAAHPTQPLTSGVWQGDWVDPEKESAMTKIQLSESDIITFHNYEWPEGFEARIKQLEAYHRPILCTEYMARGAGSTFDNAADREEVQRRCDQLGSGCRQDPDLFAVGLLAATLRADPADGVVSRGFQARRHAVSATRGRSDSPIDGPGNCAGGGWRAIKSALK